MRYTFDILRYTENPEESAIRLATYTQPPTVNFGAGEFVVITDNLYKKSVTYFADNANEYDEACDSIARNIWKPTEHLLDDHVVNEVAAIPEMTNKDWISLHVDPKHYKSYIGEYQWLDAMSRIPTLRDPDKFGAALELQIRKYLDRNGQKDATLQELKKARFYLQYWIDLIEHGSASAADVQVKLPK